ELEAEGEKTVASAALSSSIEVLEGNEPDVRAVIVDARMRSGRASTSSLPGSIPFARAIRGACPDLPILFLTTVSFETGLLFAREFPRAAVILDERLKSDRPAQIRDVLHSLQRGAHPPPTGASVDIEIGDSRLAWVVRYEPDGLMPRREIDWLGRK